MLKAVFEVHGPVDDVVTFPGRMYAFVNFQHADDAARAQEALDGKEVSPFPLPLPHHLPVAPFSSLLYCWTSGPSSARHDSLLPLITTPAVSHIKPADHYGCYTAC